LRDLKWRNWKKRKEKFRFNSNFFCS